jgi:hypothetical protein
MHVYPQPIPWLPEPSRRNLSEVLTEIGVDTELADSIEAASQKIRHDRTREAEL